MINSGPYSGQSSAVGIERITADLERKGIANKRVTTRMRDWLISRQRYWGVPIPVVRCPDCGVVPLPEEELPVKLPDVSDFRPSGNGRSPLARADEWVNTTCPTCHGPAQRETDTMDGFACSSWYFLRFTSPHYQDGPFDPQAMETWMPVDCYIGGAEHAVMHLLYARFWTKVMHDAGLVPFVEPFSQLRNQGMLLSAIDGQKMSKSRGNVVTPDEVVSQYGADVLRAYVLFLGPFDAEVTWDDRGIKGIIRFLHRYWHVANSEPAVSGDVELADKRPFERRRQQIIKRLTRDMETFRFNTAVAALMEYINYLFAVQEQGIGIEQWRLAIETITLLLSPIAPFITEEVWQNVLGHELSVHRQLWPSYDADLAKEEQVTVVVQVNGRVRERLQVDIGSDEHALQKEALVSSHVQRHINGKAIRKIIFVPDRLINIVV